MAQQGELTKKIHIPADGNWFSVSFDAIEVKKDRLVISAKRIKDGLTSVPYDPTERQYIVGFESSRAAYLRGFFKPHHPIYGWPYIGWDIHSYTNHPAEPMLRVYVQGFAHTQIPETYPGNGKRAWNEWYLTNTLMTIYYASK